MIVYFVVSSNKKNVKKKYSIGMKKSKAGDKAGLRVVPAQVRFKTVSQCQSF